MEEIKEETHELEDEEQEEIDNVFKLYSYLFLS
jgi:hypothetical protein